MCKWRNRLFRTSLNIQICLSNSSRWSCMREDCDKTPFLMQFSRQIICSCIRPALQDALLLLLIPAFFVLLAESCLLIYRIEKKVSLNFNKIMTWRFDMRPLKSKTCRQESKILRVEASEKENFFSCLAII